MQDQLTPGKKAALTRKRRAGAKKAQQTRKLNSAFRRSRAAEAASKAALKSHCDQHGWRLTFFEGKTGAPRNGIIDAVLFRISQRDPDVLRLMLVQLKGGRAGISGAEITRLKRACKAVEINWLIAESDGDCLHLLPAEPED